MKALYPRPTALAQWFDRAQQFSAALPVARTRASRDDCLLLDSLPERLRPHVAAIHLEGSCLDVLVRSHEAAAVARMARAELQAAVNAKGLKCNEFRVRIQAARPNPPRAQRTYSPSVPIEIRHKAARIKSERMQTALLRLARTLER